MSKETKSWMGEILVIGVVIISIMTVAHWIRDDTPAQQEDRGEMAYLRSSQVAATFIMREESFSPAPYGDYGQHSVGYGTSVAYARSVGWTGNTISEKEAVGVLFIRLINDRSQLEILIPGFCEMPIGVIVATHSAFYNCPALVGPNYRGYLSKGDWDSASKELAYNHTPKGLIGLIHRRVREANRIRTSIGLPKLKKIR